MEATLQFSMAKKKLVLFFSRNYQSKLFSKLVLENYDTIHVVLTKSEKRIVERNGGKVVGCFEEDLYDLQGSEISDNYLVTSFGADRFLKKLSIADRCFILSKEISFWKGIFEMYKPLAVINEPVALEISEVLYVEAKKFGIKYLTIASFLMQESFWFQDDPMHSRIRDFDSIISDNNAKQLAVSFFEQVLSKSHRPFYVKNSLLKRIVQIQFAELICLLKSLLNFVVKRDILILKSCYEFDIASNLSRLFLPLKFPFKHFLYNKKLDHSRSNHYLFPLHFEPEAVLSYASYHYENQVEILESILKAIAVNDFLIVKEHPNQPFELLKTKYYKLKLKYPNLIFVSSTFENRELFEHIKAVFTIGSSFGIEALIHGVPVVNLGRIYYDQFPGVINIESNLSMYNFLRGDNLCTVKVNKAELVESLAKVFSLMMKGKPFPHTGLLSEDNIRSISRSLSDQLNSIKN